MIPVPLLPTNGQMSEYDRLLTRRLQEIFLTYSSAINTLTPLVIAHRNGTDLTLTVNGTNTIVWTTETVDTHAWFDTSTGAFTPKMPGYYRVTLQCEATSGALWPVGGYAQAIVRFNGTETLSVYKSGDGSNSGFSVPAVTETLYCNGSTDYIDTAIKNAGTPTTPKLGGAANRSRLLIERVNA